MGHQELAPLPKTREWRKVVDLIGGGANVARIAAASARAAEKSMIDAAKDPAVRQSFYLLTQLPIAARSDDFIGTLRKLGIQVSERPTLVEIGCAMMDAIDRYVTRLRNRTDYGEIAQLSAVESVQAVAGRELKDLFGDDGVRVQTVLGALRDGQRFSALARDFFFRLTRRHLSFYLHREFARDVGMTRRFASLLDHELFEEALDTHCREACGIIRYFAERWYGKHLGEDDFDQDLAGRFVAIATKKIREELMLREPADA